MNRRLHRFFAALLALMLLTASCGPALAKSKKKKNTPSPTPAVSAADSAAFIAAQDAYLLGDMDEQAERILPVPFGAEVTVLDEDQDENGLTWCLIEYEEEIGFVSRDILSEEPPQTASPAPALTPSPEPTPEGVSVTEDGWYSDVEHVAEYIRRFGKLPGNYLTKQEAQDKGWVASWGNLWKVAPGMSIGGDRFGNYEGQLPTKRGRVYYECDIDFDGTYRNGKRIVFSNDGLIFYTDDHYETFEDITQR